MNGQLFLYTAVLYFFQNFLTGCVSELNLNFQRRQHFNLSCFICHSETQADCLKIDDSIDESHVFAQSCGMYESACMVKRISFTTSTGSGPNNTLPMKTVAIKRNCTQKCEPGCVIMGRADKTNMFAPLAAQVIFAMWGSGASRSWPNLLGAMLHIPSTMYNVLVSMLTTSLHLNPAAAAQC